MDKTPQASVAPVEHEVSRRNMANVKDDSNTRQRLIKSGLNFILEFGKHIQFESDLERRKEVMTEFPRWRLRYPSGEPQDYSSHHPPIHVLHCIFFLGHIYKNPVPPESFFTTEENIQEYKELFPRAFQQYASHLPTRTPFSILLDLVSRRNGSTNSEAILNRLAQIKKALQDDDQTENNYTLTATVITECYSGHGQERFYGASLSCSGSVETRIMIALSCIQTWNEAVAHAVCTLTGFTAR